MANNSTDWLVLGSSPKNEEWPALVQSNDFYAVTLLGGTGTIVKGNYQTIAEALADAESGDTVRLNGDGPFTVDGSAATASKTGVFLDINNATLNASGDAQALENYKAIRLSKNAVLNLTSNFTLKNIYTDDTLYAAVYAIVKISGTSSNPVEVHLSGLHYRGKLEIANDYATVCLDSTSQLVYFTGLNCKGTLVLRRSLDLSCALTGYGTIIVAGESPTLTVNTDLSNFTGTFIAGQNYKAVTILFAGDSLVYGNTLKVVGDSISRVILRKAFTGTLVAGSGNIYLCSNLDGIKLGGSDVSNRVIYAGDYVDAAATESESEQEGRSIVLNTDNVTGTIGSKVNQLGAFFGTAKREINTGTVELTLDGVNFENDSDKMGVSGAAAGAHVSGDVNVTMNGGTGSELSGVAGAQVDGKINVTLNAGWVNNLVGVINPAGDSGMVNVQVHGGTAMNVYGAALNSAYGQTTPAPRTDIAITVGEAGAATGPVVGNISGASGISVGGDVNITLNGGTVTGDIYAVGAKGVVGGDVTVTVDGNVTGVGNVYALVNGASVAGKTTLSVNKDVLNGDIVGFDRIEVTSDTLTVNGKFQLSDNGYVIFANRNVLQDGAEAEYVYVEGSNSVFYINEEMTYDEIAEWKEAHNIDARQDVRALGTVTVIHNDTPKTETLYLSLEDALAEVVSGETIRLNGKHEFTVDGGAETASKDDVTLYINKASLTAFGDQQGLANYNKILIGSGGLLTLTSNYTLKQMSSEDDTAVIKISGTETAPVDVELSGLSYKGKIVIDNQYATCHIGNTSQMVKFSGVVCNGTLILQRSFDIDDCKATFSGNGNVILDGVRSSVKMNGNISEFTGTFVVGVNEYQEKFIFDGDNLVYGTALNVSGGRNGTVELRKALDGRLNADGVTVYLYGNTDNLVLGGSVNGRLIYAGVRDGVGQSGREIALNTDNVVSSVGGYQHVLGSFLGTAYGEQLNGAVTLTLAGVDFAHELRDDIGVSGTALQSKVGGNVEVTMNGGVGSWLAGAWGSEVDGITDVTLNSGTVQSLFGVLNSNGGSGNVNISVNGGTVINLYGSDVNADFNGGTITAAALNAIDISIGSTTQFATGPAPVITNISGAHVTRVGSMNMSKYRARSVSIKIDAGTIGTIHGSQALGVDGDIKITLTGGTVTDAIYAGSEASTSTGATNVTMYNGVVNNIYGGGAGRNSSSRVADIDIKGGTVFGNIYAGGLGADYIYGDATVTVGNNASNGGARVGNVYALAEGAAVKGFSTLVVNEDTISGDVVGFDGVVINTATFTFNGKFQLSGRGVMVLASQDTLVKGSSAAFLTGGTIYINEIMTAQEINEWKASRGMNGDQVVIALSAEPVETEKTPGQRGAIPTLTDTYTINLTDDGSVSCEDVIAPFTEWEVELPGGTVYIAPTAHVTVNNSAASGEVRGAIQQLNGAYKFDVTNNESCTLAICGSLYSTDVIVINNQSGAILNGGSALRGAVVDAKAITLNNYGYAAVDLTASGSIFITNSSTGIGCALIGSIAGDSVKFTGAVNTGYITDTVIATDMLTFNDGTYEQILNNCTFAVTQSVNSGRLTFVGKNKFVSFEAMTGEGWLTWDITGSEAYVNDYALLNAATAAQLYISVNADQSGNYVLAGNAASASGMVFTLQGTTLTGDAARITVDGAAVNDYDNHRRYKLTASSGQLELKVETTPYANTIFFNSAWTVGEEVSFTFHGEEYNGVVGATGGTVAFFSDYGAAKKEACTNTAINVLESGTIGTYQHFDGYDLVFAGTGTYNHYVFCGSLGTVDSSCLYDRNSSISIEGGTFKNLICGADAGNKRVKRVGDVTLNISGGEFGSYVIGGMYYTANHANGDTVHEGNVFLNISGGSFATRVYGGDFSYKSTIIRTSMTGNVNIKIDASENVITFGDDITAGSRETGVVDGDTSVTFTGSGENLIFAKSGAIVTGGCSGDYYLSSNHDMASQVKGSRTLNFASFQGEFSARMEMFTNLALTGQTAVEFTYAKSDLRHVSTWNFEYGSSASGLDVNDFTGDTLNFATTGMNTETWTALSADTVDALSSLWDVGKVYFDGNEAVKDGESFKYGSFTLALSDDQKSLVVSKALLA